MRLIGLVGLPGSGKTWWINEHKKDIDAHFIDDIEDFKLLEDVSQKYSTIYFSSPKLCHHEVFESAKIKLANCFPTAKISWIFWENDVEKAYKNTLLRNDGRVISKHYIQYLSDNYKPGENVLEIY